MAVTELAWLTLASETITKESKVAINNALNVQDEWCIRNAPGIPKGRENRGAAFFQQNENPSVTLLTAHWESVEQHKAWIASSENQTVFPALGDYFQLDKTVFFHVDDVELFKTPDAEGTVSLLDSPIVMIGTYTIPTENRQAFDQGWDKVKGTLEELAKPGVVKSGWRIEKEDQDQEEYVLASGWSSIEGDEVVKIEEFQAVLQTLGTMKSNKHYHRIL